MELKRIRKFKYKRDKQLNQFRGKVEKSHYNLTYGKIMEEIIV